MKNDYSKFNFWIKKENNYYLYFIRVNKQWINVSKEIYTICRNSYRKINRDNYRDNDIICHYDNFEIAEIDHSNFIKTNSFENDIEQIVDKLSISIQIEKLYKAVDMLSNQEKEIIVLIYFKNKTTRETADILHLPCTSLHNKKIRILKKLRKILEQNQF